MDLVEAARAAFTVMGQTGAGCLTDVPGARDDPRFADWWLPLSYLRTRPRITLGVCDKCGRWETIPGSASPKRCRMKLWCDGQIIKV